jgi:hypothetical protein
MIKQAYMTAMALALALAAGSAQAGGSIDAGDQFRSGKNGNGVQLNGIPASGFAVETVELPDGTLIVDRGGHGSQGVRLDAISASGLSGETAAPVDGTVSGVQLAAYGRGRVVSTFDGRSGNGVQLNGIPAGDFAVETVALPDGTVVVRRGVYEKQCILLGAMRPGSIPVMSGSRGYERQCVQLSAIPAIARSRETMQPVDGILSGVQLAAYGRGRLVSTTGG